MYVSRLAQASLALLGATGALAGFLSTGRHIKACEEGRVLSLHCYSGKDDVPQNVNINDVAAVAKALRDYGREVDGGRFLTMTTANALDCAGWDIFKNQTVLALTKHIDPRVNTSVLYEEISRTIDGGPSASDADNEKAIVGCLSNGGSLGVLVNNTDPAYHSPEYKESGYTPKGILIKIVANLTKVDL